MQTDLPPSSPRRGHPSDVATWLSQRPRPGRERSSSAPSLVPAWDLHVRALLERASEDRAFVDAVREEVLAALALACGFLHLDERSDADIAVDWVTLVLRAELGARPRACSPDEEHAKGSGVQLLRRTLAEQGRSRDADRAAALFSEVWDSAFPQLLSPELTSATAGAIARAMSPRGGSRRDEDVMADEVRRASAHADAQPAPSEEAALLATALVTRSLGHALESLPAPAAPSGRRRPPPAPVFYSAGI